MLPQFVGKHETAILIGFAKHKTVGYLLMVCTLQACKNKGRNSDGATLAVLSCDDLILSLSASDQLQLLI